MDVQGLRRLLLYYSACVRSEAEGECIPLRSGDDRFALLWDHPLAFRAIDQGLPFTAQLQAWVRRARQGQQRTKLALHIGFPAVVGEGGARRGGGRARWIASLVSYELTLQPSVDSRPPDRLFCEDEVESVNSELLKALGCDDSDASAIKTEMFAHYERINSADALAAVLAEHAGIRLPVRRSETKPLLTGIYGVPLLWLGESHGAVSTLLDDLAYLSDRGNAEATRRSLVGTVLGGAAAGAAPETGERALLTPLKANAAQERAIRLAMVQPLTVVTGPPGTGKSQFIVDLVATCWAAGQTVLVASTNNLAVDVVAERLQKIHRAAIVRTGKQDRREGAARRVEELSRPGRSEKTASAVRREISAKWSALQYARTELERRGTIDGELEVLLERRDELLGALQTPTELVDGWPSQEIRRQKAKAMELRQARLLGDWRRRRFCGRFGVGGEESFEALVELLDLEHRRRSLLSELGEDLDVLVRRRREEEALYGHASETLLRELVEARLAEGGPTIREEMGVVRQVRSSGSVRRFTHLCSVLPGWATTSLSVNGSIPRSAGVFDVVVVDEASQCSIPACLPLLFRAKRAVIVGDPHQLNHITHVSPRDEESVMRRHELEPEELKASTLVYSECSMYDAARHASGEVILLDEHYRCHPRIIGISNRLFYGGQLAILTDPERSSAMGLPPMGWRDVRGEVVRPMGGSVMNLVEAEAVVKVLQELLLVAPSGSVGVITPFRAQAHLLKSLAEQRLRPEQLARLGELDDSIGTVHLFQGNEREAIVFSPVMSRGMPAKTAHWLSRPASQRLLNVALTRAKSCFVGVGDVGACRGLGGAMAKVVDAALVGGDDPYGAAADRGELHSAAEKAMYRELLRNQVQVTPKALWHHIEMDFLVTGPRGQRVDLEVDGRHHLRNDRTRRGRDMSRDDLLEKNGYQVVRVPDWICRTDPEQVVLRLMNKLRAHD